MLDQQTDTNPGLTLSEGALELVKAHPGCTLAELVHIFNAKYVHRYPARLTGKNADKGEAFIRDALQRWRQEDA